MSRMIKILISVVVYFNPQLAMATSPKDMQQSTTVNQISSQFLSSRLQHEGLKNTLVSSVSLYYALSILERGAAGDTADLLHSLLLKSGGLNVTDVAPALENVLTSSRANNSEAGLFRLTNSVWATNGASNRKPFVFSEQFREDAKNYYGASAHWIDFMASGASQEVNDWAFDATDGLIANIIDDATIRELVWLIANAAYFEGAWATRMRRTPRDDQYLFKMLNGMQQSADTIVTEDYESEVLDREDGSVAFKLPFIGGKYSLIIFLPSQQEDALKQWLKEDGVNELPKVVIQVLENRSKKYKLFVKLPVFAFSDEVTLLANSNVASDLGLSPLFSNQADFTSLVDYEASHPQNTDTRVELIKQDTKIELDENGVKAAAVTLIGGIVKMTTVVPPLPKREIIVDRPFVFAIVENNSQAIMFNGVLVQPED